MTLAARRASRSNALWCFLALSGCSGSAASPSDVTAPPPSGVTAPSPSGVTAPPPSDRACGSTERTASREGYPPTLPWFDEAGVAARGAAFSAETQGLTRKPTIDPVGMVETAGVTAPVVTVEEAARFFRAHADFYGLAPDEARELESCGELVQDYVIFWQSWGPYRVSSLFFSSTSTAHHFYGHLGPAPDELPDEAFVGPLVGREGVLSTKVTHHMRPCDPKMGPDGKPHGCGGSAPKPETTTQPRALAARDLEVVREVKRYRSVDGRSLEVRIVATARVRLNETSRQAAGGDSHSTETKTSWVPARSDGFIRDAVTGEEIDPKRIPW